MKRMFVVLSSVIVALATIVGLYSGAIDAYRTKLFPWPWEKEVWDSIPMGKPGACDALRQVTKGYYAEQASDLILRKKTVATLGAEPRMTLIPEATVLAVDARPTLDEGLARQDALSRFHSEIEKTCQGFSQVDGAKFVGATSNVILSDAQCEKVAEGFRCGITHDYSCTEYPRATVEICGEEKVGDRNSQSPRPR